MFGRIYYVETGFQTVSSAQDLLELLLPSDLCVSLIGLHFSQSSDIDMEFLQLVLKRGIGATSGSGGATPTIQPRHTGNVASSVTAERNNTTQAVAGGGTLQPVWSTAVPVLGGEQLIWPPEIRPVFSPSQLAVVSISAPADALTCNCGAVFEEIGG